ncbi:HD-domain/PDEase-like protein [Epithele typhae]|uniref:HD-domain/PDEase-like protein n=1 Tax=Epithele typhae TaxID=378194 RepID=UPI0020087751|nr:HD-domain/PDEase-like protein [Epithele typhae]KAH9936880.1 HD-domain/PDEase-like protein [Epithele typhae]
MALSPPATTPEAPPRRNLLSLDEDAALADAEVDGLTTLRRFKDSIHDLMPFGPAVCAVIDTPQFQRLRHIKQLGTSYYVWPGASHNRFEHCLGVAYLSQIFAEHLKARQPSLGITTRDVQCVTIAGLCHDLGHGPWSHVWDSMFIPAILPDKKWCHEDASNMMFDDLIKFLAEKGLDFDPDDARFVKALIMGDRSLCSENEKPFIFQIVANKTNGIDVDKFDYIGRDSHAIDQTSNLALKRLMYSARVIDNELCYDIKDAHQIFELCHTRMSLHKRIYTHKTGKWDFADKERDTHVLKSLAKAIEFMIVDALKLAEPVMNIARRLEDPKKYLHLTDEIMGTIESSDDPRLTEAQAILQRICVRDLYRPADSKVFRWDQKQKLKATFTPHSVVQSVKDLYENRAFDASALDGVRPEDVAELSQDHVIVDFTARHHGMQDENPLDYIKFYSKRNPNVGMHAEMDDISVTLPLMFGEVLVRVYTRDSRFLGLVQLGFRQVLKDFTRHEEAASLRHSTNLEIEVDLDLDERPASRTMATPPAEPQPSPSRQPARTLTRRGSRVLARHPSGVVVETHPMKENPFMTLPASYPNQSPKKGKKRERERTAAVDSSGERADAAAVAAPAAEGGGGDTDSESLDLNLMDVPAMAGVGAAPESPPPKKKSKS